MKHIKLAGIIVALIVLLMIQSRTLSLTKPINGLLGDVINPIIYNAKAVTSKLRKILNNYVFLVSVQEENTKLKDKLAGAYLENYRLREILNYFDKKTILSISAKPYKMDYTVAKVIIKNIGTYSPYITINKGIKDNIQKNDIVLANHGLLGRVLEINRNSAKVMTIFNSNSHVAVRNLRTGAQGILSGDGKGGLTIDYYPKLDIPHYNDRIVTTGIKIKGEDSLYLSGIPVGTISYIEKPNYGIFSIVNVNNFYKLNEVMYVLVIKNIN